MPFNGNGVYDLPQPPVVGGTTIATGWANTTMNDIKSALSSVLVRDGQAAMTGNLNMGNQKITALGDGTVGAPAVAFQSASNTGLYSPAAGQVALSANGTQRYLINGAEHTITGNKTVTGNQTVNGNGSFGGTLGVTGAATVGSLSTGGAVAATGDVTSGGKHTATNQICFSASTSANGTNGAAFSNFGNVDRNVGNGFNATNGIFTAPVAGWYAFSAHLGPNGGTGISGQLVINGLLRAMGSHVDNSGARVSISGMGYLAAGQTAYILCNINSGVTSCANFQGVLIA